jgi:hypothetical protein
MGLPSMGEGGAWRRPSGGNTVSSMSRPSGPRKAQVRHPDIPAATSVVALPGAGCDAAVRQFDDDFLDGFGESMQVDDRLGLQNPQKQRADESGLQRVQPVHDHRRRFEAVPVFASRGRGLEQTVAFQHRLLDLGIGREFPARIESEMIGRLAFREAVIPHAFVENDPGRFLGKPHACSGLHAHRRFRR